MTIHHNFIPHAKDNQDLYAIRSIVSRYIETIARANSSADMTAEDQDLFYHLKVLLEVILNSRNIADMWSWIPAPGIRKMLIAAGEKRITTSIDQSYISMFIVTMDAQFDAIDDVPEQYIEEYYGTFAPIH